MEDIDQPVIKMIEQPIDLKVNLFPHQLAIVHRMERIEEKKIIKLSENQHVKTNMAIYSDITGYGKTLSIIALILRNKMTWKLNEAFVHSTITNVSNSSIVLIEKKEERNMKKVKTTLVLVSPSIFNQWCKEFKYTNLKILPINSNINIRISLITYDVVIVNSNYFNAFIDFYPNIIWKRMIYDEPGNVSITKMKPIYFGFLWLITATPSQIYNNFRMRRNNYMRNLININNINYLIVKNDDDFVRRSYESLPIDLKIYKVKNVLNVLRGVVNPQIQELVNCGNIEHAINLLGGKHTDNIFDLVKNSKVRLIEHAREKLLLWQSKVSSNKTQEKIAYWSNKIMEYERDIERIDSRIREVLKDDCIICSNELKDPIIELQCHNVFCGKCIFEWMRSKHTCPMCRQELVESKLVHFTISDSKEEFDDKEEEIVIGNKTKEEVILDIINKYRNGKIIIYSSWLKSFSTIITLLDNENILYSQIKGNSDSRENIFESYRNGNINILFLNSKSDCSGINLQNTTDIILYHEMEETIRQQIIGRANRIGRNCGILRVHQLI